MILILNLWFLLFPSIKPCDFLNYITSTVIIASFVCLQGYTAFSGMQSLLGQIKHHKARLSMSELLSRFGAIFTSIESSEEVGAELAGGEEAEQPVD